MGLISDGKQQLKQAQEKLYRAIRQNIPQAQVFNSDPSYGSYIELKFRGKKQRFKLPENSSSLTRR
jgi:hypothetical protein